MRIIKEGARRLHLLKSEERMTRTGKEDRGFGYNVQLGWIAFAFLFACGTLSYLSMMGLATSRRQCQSALPLLRGVCVLPDLCGKTLQARLLEWMPIMARPFDPGHA